MKKFFKNKRILSSVLAFIMFFGLITVPEKQVHAQKAEHIVISEVYGGGGNNGATYKNDFIELYNPTDKDIDLSGWKIEYTSKAGTFDGKNITDLSGTIKASGYFLIQQAKGTGGTEDLPMADIIGNIAMGGSECKVRLVDASVNVIDFVGVGAAANESEGGKPAKGMSNTFSVQRKDNIGEESGITNGWDTDNNENDFYAKEPTPRNSSYTSEEVEEIKLESLDLGEGFNLEIGETNQLVVVYSPENTTEKDVEYRSLNPEIISVDENGKVTALALGEGKVEIKSKVHEEITAIIDVTVVEPTDKTGPIVSNLKPSNGENIGELRTPEISATFEDESEIDLDTFKLSINDKIVTDNIGVDKNGFKYTVKENLEDGQHKITVELKDEHGNSTVKEWKFTVGTNQKNLYFGQLHSHTNLSDGTGSVDDAYQYARNTAGVDFLAITDHSNWFDNDTKVNIADGSASAEWKLGQAAADKYNVNGEFAALYGYEMTWSGSTGGYGHMNTFNTPGFETRTNSKMDLKTYYDTLKTQPQSLSQFNHPGKTFGDFSDFAHYDAAIDDVVTLIEVGNGEGAVRGSGYFPSYEYYTRALDKGWHVAPTNGQDNHKGKWGDANTTRTVVEAYDLSRESLYDAIRERRVYSTEDENLKISYEVNGNTMGSIIPETDVLNFSIDISDEDIADTINKVSIIGDGGKVVKSFNNINKNTEIITFTLNESVSSYYYVRIDQGDGDIAVTAPVWVGEKESFGISSVKSDTELILENEEFNIETTIFNNEANPITNIEASYYLGNSEEALSTEKIESIDAGSTKSSKLKYSFEKPGKYTFKVKVKATIKGIEKEYTQNIDIEVVGASKVSKVVIDGAHQNQYVTGDYADKISTLTALMSTNNIKAIINKEEITDKVLEGASLLILTDPQSVTKTDYGLTPHKYTKAEAEAIGRFAKSGGNVIITSKADYGDGAGEYGNAAQGNIILEAMGAKVRFNDDQATDDVTNGGQNYRLYLTNYNLESPWMKGVSSEKTYSFYSGSTLIMPEDLTNIDILVRGHSTTYGNDADKKGDNTPVKQGEVVGLAVETLESGAKVIMSGATFLSNFEIESGEYSNTKITENLITTLAKAPEISVEPIEAVRIDADGDNSPDRFGETVVVEGYVTSGSNASHKGNSFFDVIYVQDETAGLTVFGVSNKEIKLGQKVRIKGKVSSYLGDAQVKVEDENADVLVIDEKINLVEPTKLSTKDSMLESKEGLLVKVEGKVTKIEGQNIFVDDGSGAARVFVEGYIFSSKNPGVSDEWKTRIKVGDIISAIGLASEEPEGSHRLRVRDSAEVEKLKDKNTTEVTILHTNDTHGRAVKDSSVIGIDVVSAIKNSINNSLLIDAGDTTHGLPFATMNKGLDIINLMKLAGYDLMTPGNHDFNYGYERLVELSKVAKEGDKGFDIISANTKLENELLLGANMIKEIDGVKIGFFGLSTPETAYKTNPNNVKGITFEDPIKTAEAQVKELKEKGVDVIVALAHLGTDTSSEITSIKVGEAVKGIDLIIDGHSHSKYPTGLELKNGTIIASTGEHSANLGKVTITLDKETKDVVKIIPTLINKNVTTTIEGDKAVADKIEEIKAGQNEILSKVVGSTKTDLDGARENARTKETNLGNLITDAMLHVTKADIAITNGGGIRDSIKAGEITKGSIVNVLPFGNFIVTKYLTGKEIKEVLEHGVKDYPGAAGQFTHVAGISYVFDKDKAAGERIVSIKINGKDLDMNSKYLVATNDFMAAGGDSYPNFKDAKTENEFEALDEALELYIKHLGEVDYKIEGRITVGKAVEPENPGNPVIPGIPDTTDITILHTNDTHGRVVNDTNVIGMDVVSAIKNSIKNSILIDAGDTTHGLPFATMNKGLDIINLMKLTGYDVMTPGNHDFNYGYERLLELSKVAKEGDNGFDIISANTKLKNDLLLDANIIKEVDGIKIGFFGLSTPETAYKTNPNNVKGITFEDPIKTAEAQVKKLKEKGVDVIVAVAHLGTDVSSEITSIKVGEAVKGIDLIIDGHSHSKYPTGLELKNGTIIVSTGEYLGNLGKVTITLDKETKDVAKIIPTLIDKNVTTTIEGDKAVADKIEEIKVGQNEILSKVVGSTKVDLDGERGNVRTKETNLGNLITDAMLHVTKADIAITNGGGIRASIKAGEITKGSIVNVLPFGNFIVTKYLTGKEIKEVLEHGVKDYPGAAGQFTHVAGISYVFDKDKAAGERIVSININGKDLNMNSKYLVATNDFMAAGGDSYPNFKDAKTENEFEALDEALELYIKHLGEVDYKIEDRITVGKAVDPENPGTDPEEPGTGPEEPGTGPGENGNITEVDKIKDKDGVNEVVVSKPSNNIQVEIKDIESIKSGTGSLEIKNGDNSISLPFSIIDKDILEGATKVTFKMNILENSDIIKEIKGVKKVFEFVLEVEKDGKIIKITSFKEGNATIKLKLSDEDLKGLNKVNLLVFYYNEDTNTFEPIATTINGNEVTFTTNHFSKFIIAEKATEPEKPGTENPEPEKPGTEKPTKPGNGNNNSNVLPETGGTNTMLILVFASIAVLAGAYFIIKKKKTTE